MFLTDFLHGIQVQTIFGQVQIPDIVPANPMEQHAGRFWIPLKLGHRFPILGIGCPGAPQTRQVITERSQRTLPDVRAEGGRAVVRIEREEEVICAFDHHGQHALHQGIVGIDQDVVRLESIEIESKMDDFKVGVAEQGMAETESAVRYVRRNLPIRPERQKSAPALAALQPARGQSRVSRRR